MNMNAEQMQALALYGVYAGCVSEPDNSEGGDAFYPADNDAHSNGDCLGVAWANNCSGPYDVWSGIEFIDDNDYTAVAIFNDTGRTLDAHAPVRVSAFRPDPE